MSLLDDVSIVVTPNGYKAGELYAVIPVPTEGSELVVNGDFSTDSVWSKAPSGVTISGGSANFNSASDTYVYQDILTTNKTYKIIFSGTINSGSLYIGENGVATNIYTAGTYTNEVAYFNVASSARFIIRKTGVGTLDATIDNVSVKEYTSADMDVTRATAATRVDENGLVNYAEVIGSELAICGDFECASPLTGWTVNSDGDISIDSGKLKVLNVTNRGRSYRTYTGLTIGKTYEAFVGNISGDVGGYCHITSGTANNNITLNAPFFFVAGTTTADFQCGVNSTVVDRFTFFDNISLKQNDRDNVPRIDYTGGGCPHILAEPQRTNLIPYSSDFSSGWNFDGSNVNLTRTPNATTSPSGENNATKLIGNNISKDPSNSYIGVSTSAAAPYTTSIFAKKGEYDYLVSGIGSYASGYYAIFNLSNGTVSTSPTASGTTASIEDYGNGWYRCLVNTTNTGGGELLFISTSVDGTLSTNYTNTTNGIYVWGAQLEEGSYATSYIPNFGTAAGVTRNQDIFTRDGIGSLINSTEGVLFVEMAALANDGTFRVISLTDGGTTNRVSLIYNTTNNSIRVMVVSTSTVFDTSNSVTSTLDFHKIAIKWKLNDFAVWIDGVEVATDTSGNAPVGLDRIVFDVGNDTLDFFGKVKQLQVYKTALTDEQLLQLTGESGTDFYESYAEMASALTYTIQ